MNNHGGRGPGVEGVLRNVIAGSCTVTKQVRRTIVIVCAEGKPAATKLASGAHYCREEGKGQEEGRRRERQLLFLSQNYASTCIPSHTIGKTCCHGALKQREHKSSTAGIWGEEEEEGEEEEGEEEEEEEEEEERRRRKREANGKVRGDSTKKNDPSTGMSNISYVCQVYLRRPLDAV